MQNSPIFYLIKKQISVYLRKKVCNEFKAL